MEIESCGLTILESTYMSLNSHSVASDVILLAMKFPVEPRRLRAHSKVMIHDEYADILHTEYQKSFDRMLASLFPIAQTGTHIGYRKAI